MLTLTKSEEAYPVNRVLAVAAAVLVSGPLVPAQTHTQSVSEGPPVCRGEYSAIGKDFSGASNAFWGFTEPVIDMVWAAQTVAAGADRSLGNSTAVPLITIEDGETEGSIRLKVEETEQVKYLGPESLEIMGKAVPADKFQMTSTDQTGSQYIWLSRSGLLLQLSSSDAGSGTIVLTTYEGPPL